MRFYQLWEEITALPNFDNQILLGIAKNVWGDCDLLGYGKFSRATKCVFENRFLGFDYHPNTRLVEISFTWTGGGRPGEISNKNSEFTTATTLQKGTIDGVHKFVQFATKLKEYKVNIGFFTAGKREQVYDRALKRAGYVMDQQKSTPEITFYAPI
jgi:hypothetical protein